jgi:hypothetical protein
MTGKTVAATRLRLSRRFRQKLQERSAAIYTKALERWNTRPNADLP